VGRGNHTLRTQGSILIVEDDAELRRVWRLALQLEGYEVEEAGDGISALRRLDNHPPDLVVLDLGLPALGGLSVQQEIAAQALTRSIAVVIVTGSDEDLSHVDVRCVLRKPIGPDKLVATVRGCMKSAASSVRVPEPRFSPHQ
jgi:DNA-binding response OmpR family regulator